ncbi:RNA methyltransferase [Candidatus Berkiella aquae]|uniref:tRNA (cytidine/uridine-2'-O-)-methyltransferase TrmJ n=1 Tax=Candidatus Berkiella aquae TaxID=295108 RepID=A0A0Q9YMV8_9GAMM|nr:RNA methyltransferase [Candidatus Berkiella aquae]
MNQPISIILCQTSHPGNIGASARSMKTMALKQLVLIEPAIFPSNVAVERASGADDVLANAKVYGSLNEGVANCQWLFGTSARSRAFPWPQLTPFEAAAKMLELTATQQSVGILFGNEQSGLSNEQLQQCDFHIAIPANPEYSSLNLGSAVQIICYEIYQAWLKHKQEPTLSEMTVPAIGHKANHDEIAGLLEHFEKVSVEIGFLDPKHPKKLLPRLKRLFAKAQLEKEEVNLLRGFLKLANSKKDTQIS